jgi:mitochondrial import receptor subunit TOM40
MALAAAKAPQVFLQGNMDNEGSLSTRSHWRWTAAQISKANIQIAPAGSGQDMLQVEHEYQGADFTASIKAINPSYLDGGLTGIYIGSYLQSVTSKLALGIETVWQRGSLDQPPDAVMSYAARYKGADWVAALQLQGAGALNATYWRRLSEKVQAGVDMTLSVTPTGTAGPLGMNFDKNGIAMFGAKYDFRMSTMRAQFDSKGKLSVLVERRVAAPMTMTLGAELDHVQVGRPVPKILLRDH